MARHKHSTLSDDGVEDDDLMDMASEQHPGDESFLSRGSLGAASSPDRGNQANANSPWLFDDIAPLTQFSSVPVNGAPLPETVPIPPQMQNLHLQHAANAAKRSRVDVSETCSTARRSSPCNPDYNSQIWEFDADSESSRDAVPPSTSIKNKKEAASKTKAVKSNKKPQSQKQVREIKTYNTRPRRKIVYADDGNGSEDDDDVEEQCIPSTQNATGERPKQPAKKSSPKINSTEKSTKDASPKNTTSPCEDLNAPRGSASTREKKRKQRPKAPLPFDEETQVILFRRPATPPVSERRSKKRAKRRVSASVYVSSDEEVEDTIVVASDMLSEDEDFSELCEPDEQLESRSDRPCEGSDVKRPASASPAASQVDEAREANHGEVQEKNNRDTNQASSSRAEAHKIPSAQPVEERRDSTVADSTESTNMTSPCASERSKTSPEIRAPVELPQAQPLVVPSSTRVDDTTSSIFSALRAQQEYFGGLGIMASRHASRKDEDVSRRFQDVHGVSGSE